MSPTVLDKGALDKGVDQLILSDPSLKPLFNAYDVPELKIEKNYFLGFMPFNNLSADKWESS